MIHGMSPLRKIRGRGADEFWTVIIPGELVFSAILGGWGGGGGEGGYIS